MGPAGATVAPASSESGSAGARDPILALWALAAVVGATALPWARLWVPALPACAFKRLVGIPCPACGTGRAVVLASEGRLLEALSAHPLPTAAGAVFLLGGVAAGLAAVRGRQLPSPGARGRRILRLALLLAVTAGWTHGILTGI